MADLLSGFRRRKEKPVALEGKWELLKEVRELSEALARKKQDGVNTAFLGASLFSIRRELEQPLDGDDVGRLRKKLDELREKIC